MVSKKDIVVYGYGSVAWKDRMEEWSNDGGFGDDFEDVDFPSFASIFMGNSLEGGLLLSIFGNSLAHIAEEHFTSRSIVDVRELKENNPDFAFVLDTKDDKLPNTFDLAYKRIPMHDELWFSLEG
ncbi:probable cadmium/zinc-transporting ATPase HMA1, chloroplastic isoform X2 [Phaseolus vulgaris]